MPLLELSFASGEDSLSVRRFSVHEGISGLFQASIWAVSKNEDLDLEALVGKPAGFRIATASKLLDGARLWTGVCSHIEQVQAEPTGLSTYYLRLVPGLWLLTQPRPPLLLELGFGPFPHLLDSHFETPITELLEKEPGRCHRIPPA